MLSADIEKWFRRNIRQIFHIVRKCFDDNEQFAEFYYKAIAYEFEERSYPLKEVTSEGYSGTLYKTDSRGYIKGYRITPDQWLTLDANFFSLVYDMNVALMLDKRPVYPGLIGDSHHCSGTVWESDSYDYDPVESLVFGNRSIHDKTMELDDLVEEALRYLNDRLRKLLQPREYLAVLPFNVQGKESIQTTLFLCDSLAILPSNCPLETIKQVIAGLFKQEDIDTAQEEPLVKKMEGWREETPTLVLRFRTTEASVENVEAELLSSICLAMGVVFNVGNASVDELLSNWIKSFKWPDKKRRMRAL